MPQLIQAVNEKDHFQGPLDAPSILVVYGDYQCLVCKMTLPIIKQLRKELNGKLCVVFRQFPLKTSHPHAFEAAKAAEAAGLQNKFWEMHDLLFARQSELNSEIWPKLAEELYLNIDQFNRDFHSPSIEEKLQNEFISGVRSGVNMTPCFYINQNRFDEDASYENLRNACLKNH